MNQRSNRATDRLTVDCHWILKSHGAGRRRSPVALDLLQVVSAFHFSSLAVCTKACRLNTFSACNLGEYYNTTAECKGGVPFPGHFHLRFGQEMLESINNCWSDLAMKTWTTWSDFPVCTRESHINFFPLDEVYGYWRSWTKHHLLKQCPVVSIHVLDMTAPPQ